MRGDGKPICLHLTQQCWGFKCVYVGCVFQERLVTHDRLLLHVENTSLGDKYFAAFRWRVILTSCWRSITAGLCCFLCFWKDKTWITAVNWGGKTSGKKFNKATNDGIKSRWIKDLVVFQKKRKRNWIDFICLIYINQAQWYKVCTKKWAVNKNTIPLQIEIQKQQKGCKWRKTFCLASTMKEETKRSTCQRKPDMPIQLEFRDVWQKVSEQRELHTNVPACNSAAQQLHWTTAVTQS